MTKFSGFIPSKLPSIGTSIFAIMSQLTNEHKAINLSQGFPDFDCSDKLKELVHYYMKKGYNQYAPCPVSCLHGEIIAEKTEFCYGAKYNPNTEITVTAGATEALYAAISAFVRASSAAISTRTRIMSGGRCPMSSRRRASMTARRVPASSTFTRLRSIGALLFEHRLKARERFGKGEDFEDAGHVLQRQDSPAFAFARAHTARGNHNPGDGDFFTVAAALDGGEVDGPQIRKLRRIF